jgi:hypothetical protein
MAVCHNRRELLSPNIKKPNAGRIKKSGSPSEIKKN